jgi:Mg-chelatase subunit ChlD
MLNFKTTLSIFAILIASAAFGQDSGSVNTQAANNPAVEINIGQIDASQFPIIKIYIDVYDKDGNLVKNVDQGVIQIKEKDSSGKEVSISIDQIYQSNKEKISFGLVLDKSGSMEGSKIKGARAAVINLIDEIATQNKDSLEISSFDSFVYLNQDFSTNYPDARSAVKKVRLGSQTALYDAIYSALLRISKISGPKCVIIFTDGKENASSYTRDDLIRLADIVNASVYIIGIGRDVAQADLADLASRMLGKYYFVDGVDLQTLLAEVYSDIYQRQRNRYAIQYTNPVTANSTVTRSIAVTGTNSLAQSTGSARSYAPTANVNTSFSNTYWTADYIFPDSASAQLVEADLKSLSLAELRVARNEIFARHGRQFKDPMLNKWFYSKPWYLKIDPKYSPKDFDAKPGQMTASETANIAFILKTEQDRMKNQTIFPDAGTRILSEYDVSLSKPVLEKAVKQIYQSEGIAFGQLDKLSATARKNVEQIIAVLTQADVSY